MRGQTHSQDEQRPEHAAEHAGLPRREAHHPRSRVHRVVDNADQRVDGADRQPRGDNRCEHLIRRSLASVRRRHRAPDRPAGCRAGAADGARRDNVEFRGG